MAASALFRMNLSRLWRNSQGIPAMTPAKGATERRAVLIDVVSRRRKRDGFLLSYRSPHALRGKPIKVRRLARQGREPRAVFGAMDLGVTDDGERAGHKQAAQIAVTQ
jgi:hypothetical protein